MKDKYYIIPLLCMLALLCTSSAFAVTASAATDYVDLSAEAMSASLLCNTFTLLKGDGGIILGLLIGFAGYLTWTMYEMKASGGFMIVFGICLTAFPDFFITTMNNIISMGSGIFSGGLATPCS